jgi:hypothetical protein
MNMKNVIENQIFSKERDLYNLKDTIVKNCKIEGEEDGESALKECTNISINDCYMDLRYPFWHDTLVSINNVEMTKNCRAALWYSKDISITNSTLGGIKALRECSDVTIYNSFIDSAEFGWKTKKLTINNTTLNGEYAFFECKDVYIDNLNMTGKYSFQYIKNMEIHNSTLKTKDAFWHTKDVTVTDSILEGEYLAWYSENLTLIRCHIKGTQPLCYCKNLKLIDCTMENTDLAFERSDVEANIIGNVMSIKNPKSGTILVDSVDEIIIDDESFTGTVIKK